MKKKLILSFLYTIILIFYIGEEAYSQAPQGVYSVKDSTTAFGQAISNGRLVLNLQDNKLWRITAYARDTTKLQYATKTLVVTQGSTTTDTTNIIYSTGGNNVMGQPLVCEDSLVSDNINSLTSNLNIYSKDSIKLSNENGNFLNFYLRYIMGTYQNKIIFNKGNVDISTVDNPSSPYNISLYTASSSISNTGGIFINTGGAYNQSGSIAIQTGSSSSNQNTGNISIYTGQTSGVVGELSIGRNGLNGSMYKEITDGVSFVLRDSLNSGRLLTHYTIPFSRIKGDIDSATTPNTLYYNTSTKEVSYGAAPVTDTTYIYAALDSKADTSIITRFEQDSIAKNTTIATKWSNTTNNFAYPNSKLINSANADLNIGTNGRTDISIDSLTSGQITIGNGSVIPTIYLKYTDGTMNNYISCNTGGTGRLLLNSSVSVDFGDVGTTRWRMASSTFQPAANGSYDIGATNLYVRTTYSNAVLADGTAARTWGMGRNTSGAGNDITLNAGGAASGATNSNAGNIILSSGTATGTGTGDIIFKTVKQSATSGTTDNAAVNREVTRTRTLADNGTFAMESGRSGIAWVTFGDGEEYAWFSFTTGGVVTLITYSGNVTTVQGTNDKLNIYDAGTNVTLENTFTATKTLTIKVLYNL